MKAFHVRIPSLWEKEYSNARWQSLKLDGKDPSRIFWHLVHLKHTFKSHSFKEKSLWRLLSSNTNKEYTSSQCILDVFDLSSQSCSVLNSMWPWTLPSSNLLVDKEVSQSGPSENTVLGYPKFTKPTKYYVLLAILGDSQCTYYSKVYLTWFNPFPNKEYVLWAPFEQSVEQ